MGEQIVPVKHTGMEYIVIKGYLNGGDKAFVLAIEDSTEIFIDGSSSPADMLQKTEQLTININNASTYIHSSKPVYVLQITGFGCEIGGSLLPPIRCTGSSSVTFTRSTTETLGLNIIVKSGSEGYFRLNGNPAPVSADKFQPVPGTNGEWMYAQVQVSTSEVPVGEASVLTNTASDNSRFQMGIIHGGNGGCRYGYFTNYNTGVNFGGNRTVCLGDSLILNAGIDMDAYRWSTGDTLPSITVKNEGVYWVLTTHSGCVNTDTVTVVEQEVKINLGPNMTICGNDSLTLNAGNGYKSYLWQDGSSEPEFTVHTSGTYSVNVQTYEGCHGSDSIQINFVDSLPQPIIRRKK